MSELTLSSLRCDTLARETADKRIQQRRRALLALVLQYLRDEGFIEAVEALIAEAPPGIREHRVCDNIDLDVVLQDYEAYYQLRYGRSPRITRRDGGGEPSGCTVAEPRRAKPRCRPRAAAPGRAGDASPPPVDMALRGRAAGRGETEQRDETDEMAGSARQRRTLRLPPPAGPELQTLAALVSRDLFLEDPSVRWEDIVGLESAKRVVREAVVYPLRYPQLFASSLVAPWRALLLFGPPGNGKTLLAKAVASECRTTFFNVSAATLVSKWHGDSEKLVRVLFELARAHAPSTIFLDELDALMGQRGAATEHEASRRLKTELLMQLDGLVAGGGGSETSCSQPAVFVLAASNLPWQLDQALLRRLEKRVLVGLPSQQERAAVFGRCLTGRPLAQGLTFEAAAAATDGFSAADIQLVCREAAMASIRALLRRLEDQHGGGGEQLARAEPLTEQQLLSAVRRCRPTGAAHWERHLHWRETYGAE